jgi:hypothetical protein
MGAPSSGGMRRLADGAGLQQVLLAPLAFARIALRS